MRIVDVCAFYSPRGGGVRTYVEQKLAVAERAGHDITILAPGSSSQTMDIAPGARLVTVRSPRFPLDRKYRYFDDEPTLHAALDRLEPDFVEASSPWRSPLMVANWRPDVPKALVMHADPLSAYAYRWLGPLFARATIDRQFEIYWAHLRKLGRLFDAVICANRDLGGRLSAGGVGNVFTVPMGIEPDLFTSRRRDEVLRTRLLEQCSLGPDATLLVTAGRLAPEKRVPMLIEAATAAGRHRPAGLVIFGEGRERATAMRAIGGNPHVRLFSPERDRVRFATILASADALLHGCEAETFGMTAAEAQASGTCVIVPDRGGAADFASGGNGVAYKAADRGAAVRAILALSRGPKPAFLRNAPRSMGDHFDALFGLYDGLLSRRRPQAA